jgi:uncharacterized membrane protein YecN with MAPEG domain
MVVPLPAVAVVMFYAGLNGLIAFVLSLLVVRQRMRSKQLTGTGGNPALERAIRAHGNFVEYVPLILLLLLLLAVSGLGVVWLHVMGITLTVARVLHGWGLSTSASESFGRSVGATLTWLVLLVALALCILRGAAALVG